MLDKLARHIDLKLLLFGVIGTVALWGLLFSYFIIGSGTALKQFESQMPVQSVVLERPKPLEEHPAEEHHQAKRGLEPVPEIHENKNVTVVRNTELFELTEYGALPVRQGSQTVFDEYKSNLKTDIHADQPRLYLALKGFGLSLSQSQQVLNIVPPGRASLLLSPYALSLQSVRNQAAQAGFETWLDLPVQDSHYPKDDYGPLMLRTEKSQQQNMMSFYTMLGSVYGVAGVSAFTDETMTTDMGRQTLKPAFDESASRGLGVFEQNSAGSQTLEYSALGGNAPFIQADIDAANAPALSPALAAKIAAQLQGSVSVTLVANINPVTLATLKMWLPKLEAQGVQVLPLSYGVQR